MIIQLNRRLLLTAALVALCVVPRIVVALWLFPSPPHTYFWDLSQSILTGHRFALDGIPTTYIEPGYPIVLAAIRWIARDSTPIVLLLQALIGAIGGLLLFRMAVRLASPRAAWAAVVIYAFYPYLVRQSASYLAITLTATLLIGVTDALDALEDGASPVVCGIAFGALLLTRASYALILVGAAAWLLWRRRSRTAAIVLVSASIVITPWAIRSARLGSALPSRLGENLYVSESRLAAQLSPQDDVDLLARVAHEFAARQLGADGLPEAAQQRRVDDLLLDRAVAFTRTHPWKAAWLVIRDVPALFDPFLLPGYAKSPFTRAVIDHGIIRIEGALPRTPAYELMHALAQGTILALAIAGFALRRARRGTGPMLIAAGGVALLCVVFFPTTRLLAPAMFVPMFYAGVAIDRGAFVLARLRRDKDALRPARRGRQAPDRATRNAGRTKRTIAIPLDG